MDATLTAVTDFTKLQKRSGYKLGFSPQGHVGRKRLAARVEGRHPGGGVCPGPWALL